MISLKKLYWEIKERHLRKWLAIYFSSALTVVYLVNLITNRYGIPSFIFDYTLLIAIVGLLNISVFGWFHGKEGKNNFTWKEIVAHSVIIVAAIIFVLFLRRTSAEQNLPIASNSIAVLPFSNLSDSKEDEYFSDGITDDILTNLSKINELKVISRTSSMKYKDVKKSIREIAKELGVSTVLEGSVRRSGNRVRIVSQLIDANNDNHIWSETYDRELKDIFAIQSDVASRIAAALKTELSLKEKGRIERKPTENIDAYAYYLKGRQQYNQYQLKENEDAIEMFKKALELDSNYALAYAGLADAYAQRGGIFGFEKSWLDSSIQMSEKALSLNSDLAEGYKSMGVAYVYLGNFKKALENYKKAVEINPNYAPAVSNLSSMHWWLGEYEDAYKWAVKGVQLDPARASSYGVLGLIYSGLTLDSAAEKWNMASIDLQPASSIRHAELTKLYLAQGNYDKARNYIQQILISKPNNYSLLTAAGDIELFDGNLSKAKAYYDSSFAHSQVNTKENSTTYAYILWKQGAKEKAGKYFNNIKKNSEDAIKQNTSDFNIPYDLARISAILGNDTEAFHWLKQSISYGWRFYRICLNDPLLENLHGNENFKLMMNDLEKLVNKMKERVLQIEKGT